MAENRASVLNSHKIPYLRASRSAAALPAFWPGRPVFARGAKILHALRLWCASTPTFGRQKRTGARAKRVPGSNQSGNQDKAKSPHGKNREGILL